MVRGKKYVDVDVVLAEAVVVAPLALLSGEVALAVGVSVVVGPALLV